MPAINPRLQETIFDSDLKQQMATFRGKMRMFNTGATRDTDDDKLDYEAFLSPLVLRRYAEYLNKHRKQSDGTMRAGDNWQQGIPLDVYMKSMWRHFMDVWTKHRCIEGSPENLQEALCAVLFNASGYLHEILKARKSNWSE